MAKKQRVYARIVSMGSLIRWHLTAILVGMVIQLAFTWYHHEMTMTKLDGMVDTTVKTYRICKEVGLSDCNKIRKILKGD